jgi:hypothetical protein
LFSFCSKKTKKENKRVSPCVSKKEKIKKGKTNKKRKERTQITCKKAKKKTLKVSFFLRKEYFLTLFLQTIIKLKLLL